MSAAAATAKPTVTPILVDAHGLRAVVGLSRARVYALMQDGRFPQPKRISEGRVAWLYTDLMAWAAKRPAATEPVRTVVRRKKKS